MKKKEKKGFPQRPLLPRIKRPKLLYEQRALRQGFQFVAGIDEAGRGPLAGPVVAAAVILKSTDFKEKIDDSKKLSRLQRNKAYREIISKAEIGVGIVSHRIIDQINIYRATIMAMEQAVQKLSLRPDILLIDGLIYLNIPFKQKSIVKGDSRSCSIAAASIVAKVTRDKIMDNYDKEYPQYGFKEHKGYGTKNHFLRLIQFGPSPIHRFSYRPVKDLL